MKHTSWYSCQLCPLPHWVWSFDHVTRFDQSVLHKSDIKEGFASTHKHLECLVLEGSVLDIDFHPDRSPVSHARGRSQRRRPEVSGHSPTCASSQPQVPATSNVRAAIFEMSMVLATRAKPVTQNRGPRTVTQKSRPVKQTVTQSSCRIVNNNKSLWY